MNLKVITLICLASSKYAAAIGSCEILTLELDEPVCVGELRCSRAIDDIATITELWNCTPKAEFKLHLVLEDIEDNLLNNSDLHDDYAYDQIEKLNLNDQITLDNIPQDVYELFNGLVTIDLSRNAFKNVNLDAFANYLSLKSIDLSHNNISDFDKSVQIRADPRVNVVTNINLSYNNLTIILDATFTVFKRLETLNLSSNAIKALDEFSFLGLNYLKVLDLSNNRISQTMLSLTPLVNLKQLYLHHNEIVSVIDFNLNTLRNLQTVDYNSNKIRYIEASVFGKLKKLSSVDLSNNIDCLKNGAGGLYLLPFKTIMCN